MNETFTVASALDCDTLLHLAPADDDYLWRETRTGCKVLLLLQEMYKFNVKYIEAAELGLEYAERKGGIYEYDEHVDIYARPRTLWSETLYNASPILPVFSWRLGFTLIRSNPDVHHYYLRPFSTPVWHGLLIMMLLASVLFYMLKWAEERLLGGNLECYLSHELLFTIGAYCQHYLPVNSMELTSRRVAFFSFFLFSYVIYSYYTSTLLSDLVHDKNNQMDLEMLADSTYGSIVLDKVALIIKMLVAQVKNNDSEMTREAQRFFRNNLADVRIVNITTGLEEVRTGQKALLSDYTSLYSAIKHTYDAEAICDLIEVDLFSNVIKYFFTSKNFRYTEEFRIGTLRAKETGVLRRLLQNDALAPLVCQGPHFQAQIEHVTLPLIVLACSYVFCVVILFGERVYFARNKVWPYVE